jgi:glucans biosynthesis protein
MISPRVSFTALLFAAGFSPLHAEEKAVTAPATPAAAVPPAVVESPLATGFDFETVEAEARELAAKPYADEVDKVPPYFLNLSYDQFRDIRYIPAKAQWANTEAAFRAQFFPAGLFHNRVAKLYAVESGKSRELPYDRSRYDFGKLQVPPDTAYPNGYAGFRWHGEVNTPGVWDEFAVFVGASYFRCVPTKCGATYGLSARGLAVNTAAPGLPEDFPFFKKFWLEKPVKNSRCAVAYALMDSPNVSGAFRFEIWPGKKVVTKVRSTLFVRNKVERLGIAPFSSMFWYGENSTTRPVDFRPEVHDSDGLLIEERDGRRHWRPLLNDARELRHSVFAVGKAKAFGLRQRDLAFANYEDLEAWYHKRPGVWVTPGAEWPEGAVHLMELTTGEETWDNVVAYWQPTVIPGPGESLKLEYSIMWALEPEFNDPLARVTGTHVGGRDKQPEISHYVIDFSKIPGESNREDAPTLRTEAFGDAKIVYSQIYYNAETRGWRVIVDVKPVAPAAEPVAVAGTAVKPAAAPGTPAKPAAPKFLRQGLRAWMERDGRGVSERWDYRPALVDASSVPVEAPVAPVPAVAMPGSAASVAVTEQK